jgi:hypothetical protein
VATIKDWAGGKVHPSTAKKLERERLSKDLANSVRRESLEGHLTQGWNDLKEADRALDDAPPGGTKLRRAKDVAIRDLEGTIADYERAGGDAADWKRRLANMKT